MFRFSNFCNLCEKLIDTSLSNAELYTRRAASAVKLKHKEQNKIRHNVKKDATCLIQCKRSELNFYEGQTYGRREQMNLASTGWNHYKSKGDHFIITPRPDNPTSKEEAELTFEDLQVQPHLIKRLEKFGIVKPTHVQVQGIPKILSGVNTILAAETGCGKTLAYLIPMIQQIQHWKRLMRRRPNCPIGLILTPTRELAVQIGREVTKWSSACNIKTKIFTGGKTMKIMRDPPVDFVDVIVASFGVMSKLTTNRVYSVQYVRHIVLDEADSLFEEQFEGKLIAFMRKLPLNLVNTMDENGCPKNTQLTLASATMPSRISKVLGNFINVESLHYTTSRKMHSILIPQKFVKVPPSSKPYQLLKYLKPKLTQKKSVIIYSNSKKTCDWLYIFLNNCEIGTVYVHGKMPLFARQRMFGMFKNKKVNVMCATNAGSRGLDTIMVDHVLNYDFPYATADYIHRCGRAGRLGKDGLVTNFISTKKDVLLTQKIERAFRKGKPVPIINLLSTEVEDESLLPVQEEVEEPEEIIEEIIDLDDTQNIPY